MPKSFKEMHAECRGFSKNLLSKLKICFANSCLIASKLVSQKFLKNLMEYLLGDNLFLMWITFFKNWCHGFHAQTV